MAVASVPCTRTGRIPSAMFLKENHDNMKTFKIDMKVLMDNAVSAKQVCYLSRQWLSSQFFGCSPPPSCLQKDGVADPGIAQFPCNEFGRMHRPLFRGDRVLNPKAVGY